MSKGGSDGNRETAQTLQSRAVGAAEAPAGKRASGKTKTDSIEAAGESSSLAPDYIDLRKGYRGWQGCLTIRQAGYAQGWTRETPLPRTLSGIRPDLRSLNMTAHWKPKEVKKAQCPCAGPKESIAVREHTCGIYAYKHMFKIGLEYLNGSVVSYRQAGGVVSYRQARGVVKIQIRVNGSVWMWGDIIEHTNGYRAEYAYPCAFFLPKGTSLLYQRTLRMLARLYGVDVVSTAEEL